MKWEIKFDGEFVGVVEWDGLEDSEFTGAPAIDWEEWANLTPRIGGAQAGGAWRGWEWRPI